MATFTTSFTAPTTLVPASVELLISPAEAALILAEVAPLVAGNITIGSFTAAFPCSTALFSALKAAAAQTAAVPSGGGTPPPVVVTVSLP